MFGVNYYGLKHITLGLLPKIDKENGRIINVTSGLVCFLLLKFLSNKIKLF